MQITHDEVKRLFGDVNDHMIVEIIDCGATISELQEVAAHLARETDVMGDMRRPLTGTALRLYTMLQQEEDRWREDR